MPSAEALPVTYPGAFSAGTATVSFCWGWHFEKQQLKQIKKSTSFSFMAFKVTVVCFVECVKRNKAQQQNVLPKVHSKEHIS
jgi:hypothetical protein